MPQRLTKTAPSCVSGTTRQKGSVAWRRRPRGRSSCSGCATPRTRRLSGHGLGARATWSRESSSKAPIPTTVLVDLGPLEAQLPAAEQVPGEEYVHGERLRCVVVGVRKGARGPIVTRLAHAPGVGEAAVRARGSRDRRRLGRDLCHRSRGRSPHEDRRAVAQGRARAPRARASGPWGPGCGR